MLGVNNVSFYVDDKAGVKHYYVQMTRAMEYLFLFSCGEPNKFISAIDEKYLNEIEYEKELDIVELVYDKTLTSLENFQENRVKRFLTVAENIKKKKEKEIEEDKKMERTSILQ